MTQSNLPPDFARFAEQINKRVTDLERKLSRAILPDPHLGVTWYSHYPTEIEWGPWTTDVQRRVAVLVFRLLVPGTTTTTVHVNLNGTSIGSVDLGAGVALRKVSVSSTLSPETSVLTAEVTAAGTDAEGLSVTARFAE